MALILHLSDLHLSTVRADQITGDYKASGIVPLDETQHRPGTIAGSLEALGVLLARQERAIDAVVVSGDISAKHAKEGFASLEETLSALGEVKPANDHVLVIPGNHDVLRGSPPSTPERYEQFLAHIRTAGFVTPFLEGVDIDAAGRLLPNQAAPPYVTLENGRVVIAAINSANYSSARRTLERIDEQTLDNLRAKTDQDVDAALDELEALRQVDAARVSPGQMAALAHALRHVPDQALRVAAIHHHMLPVNAEEEFKEFESISNLGQVRQFLASQGFRLVLHGHKHVPHVYIDRPLERTPQPRPVETLRWPMAVSSVATIGLSARGVGSEFARLVEIDLHYPRAPRMRISSVPSVSPGTAYGQHDLSKVASVALSAQETPVRVFSGRTMEDVYEQLLGLVDDAPSPGTNWDTVVCRIEDGASGLAVPAAYPEVPPGSESPQAWFDDVIDWWQHPDPLLRSPGFNHGERIRRPTGGEDQIASVVSALRQAPGTTRGVVVVLDLQRDRVGSPRERMPSFALIQFLMDEAERRLDCLAFFRKQQLRVWWPINVAELARLQKEVVEGLGELHLSAGAIVTISGRAIAGTRHPRVIVPWVDRQAQDDPRILWELALRTFESPADFDVAADWARVFEDWRPEGPMEPDGVPVSINGLEVLASVILVLAAHRTNGVGAELGQLLQQLRYVNEKYSQSEDQPRGQSEREVEYASWKDMVTGMIDQIIQKATRVKEG